MDSLPLIYNRRKKAPNFPEWRKWPDQGEHRPAKHSPHTGPVSQSELLRDEAQLEIRRIPKNHTIISHFFSKTSNMSRKGHRELSARAFDEKVINKSKYILIFTA
jgi:hypothetical protein